MSMRQTRSPERTQPPTGMPDHYFYAAETPTRIWFRRRRPDHQKNDLYWGLFLLGGALVMLIALVAALSIVGYLLWSSDWIMPGVRVFGIEVGGQSKAEAAASLSTYWDAQTIVLEADDLSREVSLETLGMTFDAAATVQQAHRQGRSSGSLVRFIQSSGQIDVLPVWMFDAALAESNLQALAPQLEVTSENASVQVVNGSVEVSPAVTGRRLDVAATMDGLMQNPAHVLVTKQLPLTMAPVLPELTDVSAVARQAEELLGRVLLIRAYDPVTDEAVIWELVPEVWGNWVSLNIHNAKADEFSWTLDAEQARAYLLTQVQTLGADRYLEWDTALAALTASISGESADFGVRIYHHPTQHIVQSGDTLASIGRQYGIPYPWIQHANPNLGDGLGIGQVISIPSPDELLPLPVIEDKRIVVSIGQQRMWVYGQGNLKWEWLASTGIDSSPTSPGVFQIQSHESNAYASNWDLWMPNFMGIYRPVPTSDFMNGFHGFPTRDGANLLWTGDLGHQVTYGCILISSANAAQLYEWAEDGVVVEVRQ